MLLKHKKMLILSAVLLILIFKLDKVKGCSSSNSDEVTTKAPYATTMTDLDASDGKATTNTTSNNYSTGMYICRKSTSFPNSSENLTY